MVTDYAPGSSISFEKNPDYWGKDQFHPENQLPYVDTLKILIVLDKATRLASMRTGRADWLLDVTWEDAEDLFETNPELQYFKSLPYVNPYGAIVFKCDDPELPFYDIGVRRALTMAIDQEAIGEDYFGGECLIHHYPIPPEYEGIYIPIDQLPESARERYEYDPEKAKQLLAEAGYPNGFKTSIVCKQSDVEMLSVAKAYWADIDVTLEFDVREAAVHRSINSQRTFPELITDSTDYGGCYKIFSHLSGGRLNNSGVDDEQLMENYYQVWTWDNFGDVAERNKLARAMNLRILELYADVTFPRPYAYCFWQPWVKNYGGEWSVGTHNRWLWCNFVWIDQELKESMGH